MQSGRSAELVGDSARLLSSMLGLCRKIDRIEMAGLFDRYASLTQRLVLYRLRPSRELQMLRITARKNETKSIENPPGVIRTTIAYNDQLMLCHFSLKKGSEIPMHHHAAVQNGYLISGKIRMVWESGKDFVAGPGDGWCFNSDEPHRAEILEDSEAIECFNPSRSEYDAR